MVQNIIFHVDVVLTFNQAVWKWCVASSNMYGGKCYHHHFDPLIPINLFHRFIPLLVQWQLWKFVLHKVNSIEFYIPEKLVALSYVKKCREIYHINLIIRKKVSVLYNTDTLCSILALYVLLNLLMPFLNLLMPLFQPPDATFSIFQECQSCESEVLVWVFPNHESKTSDLEKPILALPIHRIDIPEKLKSGIRWLSKT